MSILKVCNLDGDVIIHRMVDFYEASEDICGLLTESEKNDKLEIGVPYFVMVMISGMLGGDNLKCGIIKVHEFLPSPYICTEILMTDVPPSFKGVTTPKSLTYPIVVEQNIYKTCVASFKVLDVKQMTELMYEINGEFIIRNPHGVDLKCVYYKPPATRNVVFVDMIAAE